MSINPVFTENNTHRILQAAFIKHAHKIAVDAVYDVRRPSIDVFDEMNKFCRENHIRFETRTFDSETLVEDREYIEKLPAFQFYIYGDYEKTVYPTGAISVLKDMVLDLNKKPPQSVPWKFTFPKFTLFIRKRVALASASAPKNSFE
jgi:hypothetical protein